MIKFRLKYGIELSLETISRDDSEPIQWHFPHAELTFFEDILRKEIDSKIGTYGHGVSSSSIRPADFIIAIKQLNDWNPVMVRGQKFDVPIASMELPEGSVS